MSSRADVLAPEKQVIATATGYEIHHRTLFDVEIVQQPGRVRPACTAAGQGSATAPQRWRVRVSLGKLSVTLRELAKGHVQMDTGVRDGGGRVSTGTGDLNEAISFAEEYLTREHLMALGRQEVKAISRIADRELTLGEAILLCSHHYLPSRSKPYSANLEFIFGCVISIFGANYPLKAVGNAFVERFIDARTTCELVVRRNGKSKLAPVCAPATALAQMKDFAAAIRSLQRVETPQYEKLLSYDPFGTVIWPRGQKFEKRLLEPYSVDLYAWLMSPFTHPATGEALAPPVDVIDPTGALRW